MTTSNLESALSLARLGYFVFPCGPKKKEPFGEIAAKGCNSATRSELVITNWWASHPDCNIGLKCENCLVIDVDQKGGKNGTADLLEVIRELGPLPEGPVSMTPSGGYHLFFARPGEEIVGKCGVIWNGKTTGTDIRVGNQYIVAPPSELATRYSWKSPLVPVDALPKLPERWIEEFLPQRNGKRLQVQDIPVFSRPETGNLTASQRCRDYLAKVEPSISGQGGDEQLFKAACVIFWDFALSEREGMPLFQEYNMRCQPPWPQSRLDYKMTQALTGTSHDKPRGHKIEEQKPLETFGVDLSQFMVPPAPLVITEAKTVRNTVPMPENLLYVPGFVHDVTQFTLSAAPHPNPQLATLGAIACQSFLASRKVRSVSTARPSVYLLALAKSGTGKDFPRLVNQHILTRIGKEAHIVDTCASGEGLEDRIIVKQVLLMQTDEFNFMISDFAKGLDSRFRSLESLILRLYSAARGSLTGRLKAGKEQTSLTVHQPALVIFGTATPQRFQRALTFDMIEGGLASRCIVVETDDRRRGQKSREVDEMPDDILGVATWWANLEPVDPLTGKKANLNSVYPNLLVIPLTEEADGVMADLESHADDMIDKFSREGDHIAATLWTRVHEAAGRLAVIYACSKSHLDPIIDRDTARWACDFALWCCEQMNLMVKNHVAENPFHAIWLRIEETIRNNDGHASHSLLINKLKISSKQLHEAIEAMGLGNRIATIEVPTKGRSRIEYVLTDSTPEIGSS
jgi:Bifunctional DNA primase/polymerase, N-terminal.